MSAVGEKLAVVSLGSSCQSAHQIKRNVEMLARLTGEALTPKRLPFDWVICPIARTAEWIRSGERAPQSPLELAPYKHRGTFYWERRGLFFWHDFRLDGQVDLEATFFKTKAKYEHSFHTFQSLNRFDRVIFIVSNSQNNLISVLGEDYENGGFVFTLENVKELKRGVDDSLGKASELLLVTYHDRSTPDLESLPRELITVAKIKQDSSEWTGDDEAWRTLFQSYFG